MNKENKKIKKLINEISQYEQRGISFSINPLNGSTPERNYAHIQGLYKLIEQLELSNKRLYEITKEILVYLSKLDLYDMKKL